MARVFALALLDVACLFISYLIAVTLVCPKTIPVSVHFREHLAYFIVLAVVWCLQPSGDRLFTSRRSEALVSQLFEVTKAAFITLAWTIFLLALFGRQEMNRELALVLSGVSLVAIVMFRLVARLSVWGLRRRGYSYRRILIVGANDRTARLAEVMLSHEQYGYHIEGFLEDDESRISILDRQKLTYLGPISTLESLLAESVVDVVYISLPVRSHYERILSIARLCEGVGVPVRLLADLFPLRVASSEASRLGDLPLLSLTPATEARSQSILKRLMELFVSSLLLVLLAPVFAGISLLVKLDSKGPVFSRRLCLSSRGQQLFHRLRFRTRQWNPEADELAAIQQPRTRVGELLRRYSLDELPQLINVWRGHMSFTEARPQPVHDAQSNLTSTQTP